MRRLANATRSNGKTQYPRIHKLWKNELAAKVAMA